LHKDVEQMDIDFPIGVREILNILNNNGYEAFVVGGCVRDRMLNKYPHDWDICTSAKPFEVIDCFKGYRVIEIGLRHGTVTVLASHIPYEITTYRIDGDYSDNRRPDSVEFTSDIKEDLSRRDFTINAMAYNPEDGLIDPFNGIQDIEAKLIRCVGNANHRFQEDALRILRAIRFSVKLGFEIGNETYAAMLENKSRMRNVSVERINAELSKTLVADKPVLECFNRCRDIIAEFIPEFIPCFDFDQNNPYHDSDVYNHILRAVDSYHGNDLIVKLSLLFHDIGKPDCYSEDEHGGHFIGHGIVSSKKANEILKRLRFDNETIKSVTELVLYHDSIIAPNNKTIKRWLNKIGEVQLGRLIDIRTSDILAQADIDRSDRIENQNELWKLFDVIIKEEQCFSLKDLSVDGNDLIKIGYKQGAELGSALQRLLSSVIANEIENNKEDLLVLAGKWV